MKNESQQEEKHKKKIIMLILNIENSDLQDFNISSNMQDTLLKWITLIINILNAVI